MSGFYVLGFVLAVFALWRSRTPQGATAWVIALVSFPFVSVPLFLVFGRNKFYGYVKDRKELDAEAQRELINLEQQLFSEEAALEEKTAALTSIAHLCNQPGFMKSNQVDLLIDGHQTFSSMLQAIEQAEKYILIQVYIFREDRIGRRFIELLKRKSAEGVRIHFMYDFVGTRLRSSLLKEIRDAGIEEMPFRSTKSWRTRLQINFRNHRKVMVIDGKLAFVGGLNIGDDYLGEWPTIGPWRDTHVRLEGPSALAAQISFTKDWYCIKQNIPDLDWLPHQVERGSTTLVLHTGPADEAHSCLLAHVALINAAKRSIWIANPYFVPPEGLSNALELAVLRGVDVRILLPSYSDNRWVNYASKNFQEQGLRAGIRFFEYLPGFLHQKVMLVDSEIGVVGSANLDSRSMFINFEITAVSHDVQCATDLEKMLETDFSKSQELNLADFVNRSPWSKFISRAAGLLAPVL